MTDTPAKQYVAPDHFCAACRARGKTWNGSDPTCAFQHGKPFSPDNWSCATLDRVRDLAESEPAPKGITRAHDKDWGDQSWATFDVGSDDLRGDVLGTEDWGPWVLWVTWYKSRGRTGQMWLLGDESQPAPVPPTEADVLAILGHYTLCDQPQPMTPERQARIAEWDGIRTAMMAGAAEIEPGVHMLEFGHDPDDDIPF